MRHPVTGETIDECLVAFFKAPASYTGEDVVEIYAHGNPLILEKLCDASKAAGARMAEPGEFTKRAFLNGKMDLSQAEAVQEMIFASTELSLKAARERLRGGLGEVARKLRSSLLDALVHLEAAVDFPEEEIEIFSEGKVAEILEESEKAVRKLLDSANVGRILSEGARITICGRPNVGKSKLLNALLKEERAIVSDVPGTTRDFISEMMNVGGIPVRVIDTAGIRGEWGDAIEREGITRSAKVIEDADLILFVVDGSEPLTPDDDVAFGLVRGRSYVLVLNKLDLGLVVEPVRFSNDPGCRGVIRISAKTGEGIRELEEAIRKTLTGGRGFLEGEVLVSNLRQKELLEKALAALARARDALRRGESPEFATIDVKEAAKSIGEIVGEITTEDVLEKIFSTFCIGK